MIIFNLVSSFTDGFTLFKFNMVCSGTYLIIENFQTVFQYCQLSVVSINYYTRHVSLIQQFSHITIAKDNKHYNAYQLTESLDRNTCTYCNRAYTSTVTVKSNGVCITRPTLDHWYTKSAYPLLAVSFQNLIPACYSCNSSVKGTVELNLNDHTHPYVDLTQNNDFQFGYFYSTILNKYRIFVQDSSAKNEKSRKTLKSMFIDEIYNTHHSELEELLVIKKNYSKGYIQTMHNLLDQRLTKEEVYRLLFGVYYDSKDFHKRPLSKFKYDILKQIGMLDV